MLISAMAVFLECHIFILPMLFLRLTRIVLSLGYIFLRFIYLFMCMEVLRACMCVHHVYTYWIPWNWGCV